MSFIIRSNPDFNNGGLVLQAHTTRVAEDGFVEISMNFACLATALPRNLFRFRMEQPPPVALPADAAALPLETNNVYLNSLDTTTDKGIAYLRAVYVGASLDQKRNVSIKESQRSYSGQGVGTSTGTGPLLGRFLGTFNFTETFDYTSESLTVNYCAIGRASRPTLTPQIKNIRNRQNNIVTAGPVRASGGDTFRKETVVDFSEVSVGPVKRYTMTASAQAVQANSFL
jgi:hypothetical protein